jgi:hypothetical protein
MGQISECERQSLSVLGEVLDSIGKNDDGDFSPLMAWLSRNMRCQSQSWCSGFMEIVNNSKKDYEYLKDEFKPAASVPDVKICFLTGMTVYRYGLFQYRDLSANSPVPNADYIGDIEDYGLFYFLLSQSAKMLNERSFIKSAFWEIGRHFEKQYDYLSGFRDKTLAVIYEAGYRRTNNTFLQYAVMALKGEKLPKGVVGVHFPNKKMGGRPPFERGGKFAVALGDDKWIEIHECDGTGNSVWRTYLTKGNSG